MQTYAHQPDNRYFIFDIASGRTLARDLPTPRQARATMIANGWKFPATAGAGWSSKVVGDVLRDVLARYGARRL